MSLRTTWTALLSRLGLRRRINRKLEWAELTEAQRQMFLAIKQKQQRYKRLKVMK